MKSKPIYYKATYLGRTERYDKWNNKCITELVYGCDYYIGAYLSPWRKWRWIVEIYDGLGNCVNTIPYNVNWRKYWKPIYEVERYVGVWKRVQKKI